VKERQRQKYQRQAQSLLEGDEQVEAACDGFSSYMGMLLLGVFAYFGLGRVVLVTQRNVYLCKRKPVGRISETLLQSPRGTTDVMRKGFHLRVNRSTIFVPLMRRKAADEVVEVANRSAGVSTPVT
jgi:hypothetical protein